MKNTKNQVCPICGEKLKKPNFWVKYHIRYSPPLVIMACKYCNMVEQRLRTENSVPFFHRNPWKPNTASRAEKVIAFHARFGILLTT